MPPRHKPRRLRIGPRVWIGAGDQDPIIPPSEVQRLVELLRRAGADVTIRFFNAGHGLTNDDVITARVWLDKVVGGADSFPYR
jgi:phospholipase/carboxylesterase